jgi:hypothetical protein
MSLNTITLTPSQSAVIISLMGYNYDLLSSIALSSSTVAFPFLTAFNYFTNLRRVSSICLPFSGYPLSSYNVINKNRLSISLDTLILTGTNIRNYIDIIFMNQAGYTKLSDKNYIVEFNPLSNLILTINNEPMQSISGSYLVYI